MNNSRGTENPWMEILHVIQKDRFGLNIFLFMVFIFLLSILISMLVEKKYRLLESSTDRKKLETTITLKRLFTGGLIGFIFAVTAGTAQFIIRFSYWTWFQELGAIFTGVIGAVIGALIGMINWRRKL